MRFIVLDFETLNPSRRSGFSYCVTAFENGLPSRSFTRRFKPADSWVSFWAMKTFGISKQEIDRLPSFRESWRDVRESFSPNIFVVCHNAEFDISVLRNCLSDFDCSVDDFCYVCSLALAKLAWPNLKRYGLATLAEHLQIELSHHMPESDCQATGRLFVKELARLGIETSSSNGTVLERLTQLNHNVVKRFDIGNATNES